MNDCWHLIPTSLLDTIVNSSLTYLSMLHDGISKRLKDDVMKKIYDTQVQRLIHKRHKGLGLKQETISIEFQTDGWDQGEVVVYYYTSSNYQQSHFGN
ncbi:MAG: hypothetical protein EZS28_055129 [Streblomastix strix]|uniref:Uncharacterized protein n=1 Tax=Streblomastix strix TaxID=222440 RepID=A0A5J4Q980_9EUKA|nr:MAG: hypothetical protein EZS28_055129 [Streblomastix strix]